MTAFWSFPYVPDPDLLEVTGFGDPVRSFIPAARDPAPAELAEFRQAWLMAGPPLTGVPAPRERDPDSVQAIREPPPAAAHRGQCQGCGTDDEVDIWSRCAYCAELAVLRARNLPGPRLNGWWFTVPAALALALVTLLCYAVASVILAT